MEMILWLRSLLRVVHVLVALVEVVVYLQSVMVVPNPDVLITPLVKVLMVAVVMGESVRKRLNVVDLAGSGVSI